MGRQKHLKQKDKSFFEIEILKTDHGDSSGFGFKLLSMENNWLYKRYWAL